MNNIYIQLQKQLETSYKIESECCIKIYDKLLELNGCKFSETQWNVLVDLWDIGTYPNIQKVYIPSKIGVIFLNGVDK